MFPASTQQDHLLRNFPQRKVAPASVRARLISPFKMLKSCGSSSMLVWRMNFPNPVTRGSFFTIYAFFFFLLRLNFHRTELVHFKRFVVQSDACLTVDQQTGEVSLIMMQENSITGENRMIATSAPKISTIRSASR